MRKDKTQMPDPSQAAPPGSLSVIATAIAGGLVGGVIMMVAGSLI